MILTEANSADALARAVFDSAVVPLSVRRQAASAAGYFALAPDNSTSYFTQPVVPEMRGSDFELADGGTAEGTLAALAAQWLFEGDAGLVALVPQLVEVARLLRTEAAANCGEVDILCYTMF